MIALLFLVTSSLAMTRNKSIPAPSPSPIPIASPSPIAAPHGKKIVTLICKPSCNALETKQLPEVEDALNRTLLSSCFENYFNQPGIKLDMTDGASPNQIVQRLRLPATLYVDFFYKPFTRMVGYEAGEVPPTVHMNRKFTASWSVCQIASLAAHEFSHVQNFKHNGNASGPNQFTVPYQVNHAFEDAKCCK